MYHVPEDICDPGVDAGFAPVVDKDTILQRPLQGGARHAKMALCTLERDGMDFHNSLISVDLIHVQLPIVVLMGSRFGLLPERLTLQHAL